MSLHLCRGWIFFSLQGFPTSSWAIYRAARLLPFLMIVEAHLVTGTPSSAKGIQVYLGQASSRPFTEKVGTSHKSMVIVRESPNALHLGLVMFSDCSNLLR